MFFNVIFTFLPVGWFACFDWEYTKEELLDRPKLYKIGLLDIYFNTYTFWRWFFYAALQGTFLLLLTYESMGYSANDEGETGDIFLCGCFVYTAVVTIVNLKILVSSY